MKTQNPSLSRRRFLGAATAAALSFPAVLRAQSPSKKLNLAIIGCGGRGAGNLGEVAGENIVALCDVNADNLSAAAKRFPQARKYADFRRL